MHTTTTVKQQTVVQAGPFTSTLPLTGYAFSSLLHKGQPSSQVRCLNEATPDSCKGVFRPWSQRLQPPTTVLSSNDDDAELLIHVPFDGQVVLKAICIIGASVL